MKGYCKIIIGRPDGRRSEATLKGDSVNAAVIQAAEELIYTMMTGKYRPTLPKKFRKK